MDKAIGYSETDGDVNALEKLIEKQNKLNLKRGYLRGQQRKNHKPAFIKDQKDADTIKQKTLTKRDLTPKIIRKVILDVHHNNHYHSTVASKYNLKTALVSWIIRKNKSNPGLVNEIETKQQNFTADVHRVVDAVD